MSVPKFSDGDIVYLTESAKVGSLESYQITSVHSHNGAWWYQICVPMRPPNRPSTYGDRITLRRDIDFSLAEDELTTYPEALQLAITATEATLARLQALWAAHTGEETGGNP